jgi:DNA-nicking Smr family endonuclease
MSNEEDKKLFLAAMRGVRPLRQDKIAPSPPRPPPYPRQRRLDEEQIMEDLLSDSYDPAELETGEELVYLRPGMQHSVLRKLRRGHYSVRAELDLHGLFVAQARQAIGEFLRQCQQRDLTCVRIIHGKGYGSWQKQPVLKTKLNHWLRQHGAVLAFCSARAVDGGTGAVYVLIKR